MVQWCACLHLCFCLCAPAHPSASVCVCVCVCRCTSLPLSPPSLSFSPAMLLRLGRKTTWSRARARSWWRWRRLQTLSTTVRLARMCVRACVCTCVCVLVCTFMPVCGWLPNPLCPLPPNDRRCRLQQRRGPLSSWTRLDAAQTQAKASHSQCTFAPTRPVALWWRAVSFAVLCCSLCCAVHVWSHRLTCLAFHARNLSWPHGSFASPSQGNHS